LALLKLNDDSRSYDLTAEDVVLLADPEFDIIRVRQLILRVTRNADELDRKLLGSDETLTTFREDWGRE
jgi:hypothetical protein